MWPAFVHFLMKSYEWLLQLEVHCNCFIISLIDASPSAQAVVLTRVYANVSEVVEFEIIS